MKQVKSDYDISFSADVQEDCVEIIYYGNTLIIKPDKDGILLHMQKIFPAVVNSNITLQNVKSVKFIIERVFS